MPRIVKDPEVRKTEILDVAEKLFFENGLEKTSVNMIVETLGIAKGTVYYYFKSKDDIMKAVLNRFAKRSAEVIINRISTPSLNAIDKLRILIQEFMLVEKEYDREMMDYIHKNQNLAYHQQSLIYGVLEYSKIIEIIIKQGIDEGFFEVSNPKLTARYLIAGLSFLYDIHLFGWKKEEYSQMIIGLKEIFSRLLNTKEEYFSDFDTIAMRILEHNN